MTELDPKHLDALDALIDHNMQWRGLEDIDRDAYKQAREAITALRAQIDRERAATIEAAAHTGYVTCAKTRHVTLGDAVSASIRALHTDATRAAMDAIRREGYEAGVRDERAKSADLVKAVRIARKAMSTRVNGGWGWMAEFEALIAASIPPDPDATPRK